MRIAYLTAQYPKTSHTFIRREIQALERLGIEVQRYSARRVTEPLVDPDDRAESARTRVILESGPVVLIALASVSALRTPIRWLRTLRLALQMSRSSDRGLLAHLAYLIEACALVRWMKQARVEHLHAHFGTNATAVALLARHLGGPPYSFTAHGPEVIDLGPALSLDRKIHEATFVAAISHNTRSCLWRYSAFEDWTKVHVIRCGLDSDYLERPTAPLPEEPKVVCVARLDPEKGHLVLLESAGRLAREGIDFELELIGDGAMRPEIERRISSLGLERHVRLVGWLGSEQIRQHLVASRIFVLPSFSEGLPVVFMEALAIGRPVIATYMAGIPELIVNGENGWLVPASDVDELARALREALATPTAELERMGKHGRERVCAQHSVSTEAHKLADLFRGVRASPA